MTLRNAISMSIEQFLVLIVERIIIPYIQSDSLTYYITSIVSTVVHLKIKQFKTGSSLLKFLCHLAISEAIPCYTNNS